MTMVTVKRTMTGKVRWMANAVIVSQIRKNVQNVLD